MVRPGDGDEVRHLGDFAVRQSAERVTYLLNTLHGTKHLIVGNNDDAMVTGCPAGTAFSNMQKLPSMEGQAAKFVGTDLSEATITAHFSFDDTWSTFLGRPHDGGDGEPVHGTAAYRV